MPSSKDVGVSAKANTTSNDKAATKGEEPQFEGYDFAQVVKTMESSVNPLQREMDRTFQVFVTGFSAGSNCQC